MQIFNASVQKLKALQKCYEISSTSAGKAAERAAANKVQKYSAFSPTHDFQHIALKILGPLNSLMSLFFSQLGKSLASASEDPPESTFVFQCLSVTLQRFNCIAFSETFSSGFTDADDDWKLQFINFQIENNITSLLTIV